MFDFLKEKIKLHKLKNGLDPTLKPTKVKNRVMKNKRNGHPAIIVNDYNKAYGNYIVVSDLDKKNKIRKEKGKAELKYPKLSKSINKITKKDSYVEPIYRRNPKVDFKQDTKLKITNKDYRAIVRNHIRQKSKTNKPVKTKKSFYKKEG